MPLPCTVSVGSRFLCCTRRVVGVVKRRSGSGSSGSGSGSHTHTHSAITAQWLSFAGFYQKKIIKDFTQSANQHALTGFLAHGKPAVACLEGSEEDIQEFLRHVRTSVFATVPRSARKMTLGTREGSNGGSAIRARRFESFEAKAFFSQGSHHRPDMLDRKQLDKYLQDHGVPDEVRHSIGDI